MKYNPHETDEVQKISREKDHKKLEPSLRQNFKSNRVLTEDSSLEAE